MLKDCLTDGQLYTLSTTTGTLILTLKIYFPVFQ